MNATATVSATITPQAAPASQRVIASTFRRNLRRALIRDAEPELVFLERVAVLTAAGYRKGEIAAQLHCKPAELKAALDRIRRVLPDLEPPE